MAVPAYQSLLFTLPLELRHWIFKASLTSPLHGPELLRTCRQIHSEAHQFLFERPLNFRSQSALFGWLGQVPHEYLSRAKSLSLNIQEVDLSSLLNASALISYLDDPFRLSTWDLYDAELDRLSRALKQLPNIQRITIRAISGQQSFLYREFLRKFLRILGLLYPDLLDLSMEGDLHHQDLSFLSNFKKLRGFTFDGFSASSPSETGQVLSDLDQLTSLSLVSQSTVLTPDPTRLDDVATKQQSCTGGVISSIDKLTCFSVTEMIPISAPMLFFTPEVLTSLYNHQSLKIIKVCLSQAPSVNTMVAFESFLENTHIRVLELDWPDLDANVLEAFSLIPSSLEKLWVRARSAADAFDIIWSIAESRDAGDLYTLREIVLMRSTKAYAILNPVTMDRKDSGTGETENSYHVVSLTSAFQPLNPFFYLADTADRCVLRLTILMRSISAGHRHAYTLWECE